MNPAEFSDCEARYGPPHIRVFTFKLQQSLWSHIQQQADQYQVSRSLIVRHALQEYFQRLNIDSMTP